MTDPELEALLERARPRPDPAFVRATEARLLPQRRSRRMPALRVGAAVAGGFAALAFGLSLAGVGPLGDGDPAVRAQDNCRNVTVTKVERVPRLVVAEDGTPRIVYSRKPVTRVERRCR
jgi:hypothetical protein